jgi:GrpB-like predicted nucleotidyltransferase (UPF0157 family)
MCRTCKGPVTCSIVASRTANQHPGVQGPDTAINLHVLSDGCVELERMPRFRDWLRTHPEDRLLYLNTKRELAQHEWNYTQNYADAKSEVVEQIIARAMASALGRARVGC